MLLEIAFISAIFMGNRPLGGSQQHNIGIFWPMIQQTRPKFISWKCNKKWILGGLGAKFSKSVPNFLNFLNTGRLELHRWFHQNFSKSIHLTPFWSVKHWFFEEKNRNCINFWQILSWKIYIRKKIWVLHIHI